MKKKDEIIDIFTTGMIAFEETSEDKRTKRPWVIISLLKEALDSYATHVLQECLGEEIKRQPHSKGSFIEHRNDINLGHNILRQTAIEKAKDKFGLNLK